MRLARWLSSRLDEDVRSEAFEPACNDAWAACVEGKRGGPIARIGGAILLELRCLLIVIECFRLQALSRPREREDRTMPAMIWRDVHHAARSLSRRPVFAFIAVLTLALGTGANAAIFSVVNAVLLRSLPWADAGRLVMVWGVNSASGDDHDPHSRDTFLDYAAGLTAADAVAGITPTWNFTVQGAEPERIRGFFASAAFLPLLGVRPAAGRLFGEQDDRVGAPAVAVISYALWQRRFGGSPQAIGSTLETDEAGAVTVVGVLPAGFRWLDDADIWAPIALNPYWARGGRQVRLFSILAHIAPSATIEQLSEQAASVSERLARDYPGNQGPIRAKVVALEDEVVGSIRPALLVLLGAVGLVLLIACANVANLMLVRGDGRRREVAVRAALGASRKRLAREVMTESVLLSLAGGVLGFFMAFAGVRSLLSFVPPGIPRRDEIAVDAPVLSFTLGLAVLTGIVFGLAPALAAMRAQPGEALKRGSRGATAATGRLRRGLVIGEIAIALMVATGATLLMRSFARLSAVDPGFETAHVLTMDLAGLPGPAERAAFMEGVYERLAAVPGVIAAGEVSRVPLAGQNNVTSKLGIESAPVPENEQPEVDLRRASRGYFAAMGIPVMQGRMFDVTDDADAEAVVVVNDAVASRYFSGRDPIGERVSLGGGGFARIIGVVGSIRFANLSDEPRPEVYYHTLQGPLSNPQLVVRTTGDPAAMTESIRSALREAGPRLIMSRVATMDALRTASLAGPRFNLVLFALFALLAVLLGTLGAWGVMAYVVSQRTREFGVRVSLGARPLDLAVLVVRESLVMALPGLAIGVAGAFLGSRVLRSMLFEVSPVDPVAFSVTALLLAAAVMAAAALSARRATRVDPVRALNMEN